MIDRERCIRAESDRFGAVLVATDHGARVNALKLRGCDFDGGGPGVEDFLVSGSFDGPVARAVAFDDSGVGAVAAFPEGESEDFVDDSAVRVVIAAVRGEIPRSRRLRGG
jgi:hypothetical protein